MTEKSASQAAKYKCDQCSFQGASDKGVKQHTKIKHKIPQPDGQSDCDFYESEYALTVCQVILNQKTSWKKNLLFNVKNVNT